MFDFMTKLHAQTISHGLVGLALMREYCQDPTKWHSYLWIRWIQDALAHIISSCKYLSGLNSGSLRSFPCWSFDHHSETSYIITLDHYYQLHFKTWSRQKNVSLSFLVLLLFSLVVFSYHHLVCFQQFEYQPASPQSFISSCSLPIYFKVLTLRSQLDEVCYLTNNSSV